MNEVEKFFQGLPSQDKPAADVLNEQQPEKVVEPKESDEDESEGRKNRYHRRLEDKYQKEREANIALSARLQALSEEKTFIKEHEGEIDPRLVKIFGSDTPEKKELARLFSELRKEDRETVRQELTSEMEQRQREEIREEREAENFIDSELEALEDAHGVDLTSNSPKARKARTELITAIQELSPKDDEGNITDYADFGSTYEYLQKGQKEAPADNARQKEVASRSMQRSNSSPSAVPTGRIDFAAARKFIEKNYPQK